MNISLLKAVKYIFGLKCIFGLKIRLRTEIPDCQTKKIGRHFPQQNKLTEFLK